MVKHALVVDDSLTMRGMVSMAFKRMDWNATVAKDGEEAFALVSDASNKFDIIITDINMPGMDGVELIAKIRAIPAYSKTPIIALTTEEGNSTKGRGKEAGANGWMVKPFKPEVLQAAVSKLCG